MWFVFHAFCFVSSIKITHINQNHHHSFNYYNKLCASNNSLILLINDLKKCKKYSTRPATTEANHSAIREKQCCHPPGRQLPLASVRLIIFINNCTITKIITSRTHHLWTFVPYSWAVGLAIETLTSASPAITTIVTCLDRFKKSLPIPL